MSVSVVRGKWGPCCSKEPSGKRTTLVAGLSRFTSGQVRSSRRIRLVWRERRGGVPGRCSSVAQSGQGAQDFLGQGVRRVLAKGGVFDLIAALGPFLRGGHIRQPPIGVAGQAGEGKRRLQLDGHDGFTERLNV